MTKLTVDSVQSAFEFCRRYTRTHYENFSVATFLLPKKWRSAFYAVYAYCRFADDLADESETPEIAIERLDSWNRDLDRCFEGHAEHPIFVALKETVHQYQIPKKPFADLLIAFRRDQTQNRYADINDLLDYCQYSADPVGRIILYLAVNAENAGPISEEMFAYSDSICSGLQLANFWQDVARDWTRNRIYIPKQVAEQFGVDVEQRLMQPIGSRKPTDSAREMMQYLVQDARTRLKFGEPLIRLVPKLLRTDLRLFINGGLAVLDAIENIDYDIWNRRPIVTKWKKFVLLMNALLYTKSSFYQRQRDRAGSKSRVFEPGNTE
ncbi:MAG: squalene synthase HpnC [Thermoguttaceae bacterium]